MRGSRALPASWTAPYSRSRSSRARRRSAPTEIITPCITVLATQSSIATLPTNLAAAKRIGATQIGRASCRERV